MRTLINIANRLVTNADNKTTEFIHVKAALGANNYREWMFNITKKVKYNLCGPGDGIQKYIEHPSTVRWQPVGETDHHLPTTRIGNITKTLKHHKIHGGTPKGQNAEKQHVRGDI